MTLESLPADTGRKVVKTGFWRQVISFSLALEQRQSLASSQTFNIRSMSLEVMEKTCIK